MCVYVYIYKMKVIQSHIVILQHLKYLLSFLLSSYLTGHLLLKVCTLPLPWSFPRRYMVHAYMFFRWLVKWHCFWETLLDHPSKIACSHYPCSLHSLPPSTIHKHHQGPGVPAPRLCLTPSMQKLRSEGTTIFQEQDSTLSLRGRTDIILILTFGTLKIIECSRETKMNPFRMEMAGLPELV